MTERPKFTVELSALAVVRTTVQVEADSEEEAKVKAVADEILWGVTWKYDGLDESSPDGGTRVESIRRG